MIPPNNRRLVCVKLEPHPDGFSVAQVGYFSEEMWVILVGSGFHMEYETPYRVVAWKELPTFNTPSTESEARRIGRE